MAIRLLIVYAFFSVRDNLTAVERQCCRYGLVSPGCWAPIPATCGRFAPCPSSAGRRLAPVAGLHLCPARRCSGLGAVDAGLVPDRRLVLRVEMCQHLLEVELVNHVAADRAMGVVFRRGLVRLDSVAWRHDPKPPAAVRQIECGGLPSATSNPFASAWRMAASTAASSTQAAGDLVDHDAAHVPPLGRAPDLVDHRLDRGTAFATARHLRSRAGSHSRPPTRSR